MEKRIIGHGNNESLNQGNNESQNQGNNNPCRGMQNS